MKNLMAKGMSERYEEYLCTDKLEERGSQNIYYWVMSTIESVFWGTEHAVNFFIDLYAKENKMILLFQHPSGEKCEYIYRPSYWCTKDNLPIMLQKFEEIFNDMEYPLTEKIASPIFRAYNIGRCEDEEEYKGYEHLGIYVDMLPPVGR